MRVKLIFEQIAVQFIVPAFFFPEALRFIKLIKKHRHFLMPMLRVVAQFIESIWTR
jgi:hypothetical protein